MKTNIGNVSRRMQQTALRAVRGAGFNMSAAGAAAEFWPVDSDILTLAEVAFILRSTVDTIRRIPRSELATFRGPGRERLYLRRHVIAYLEARQI